MGCRTFLFFRFFFLKEKKLRVVDFNPSTRELEVDRSEFEANLFYRATSRTAGATQRNKREKKKLKE